MKVQKKVLHNLEKCYSIAPLFYQGQQHILVAAEKHDRCLLFDADGNLKDTVWSEPGGVMTMVQIPNSDGQFMATHKFYSPNDSKEAKLIIATPIKQGEWEICTLVHLPHVHRFDILKRNGVHYLIACTLKSGHEHKDDWSMPGKVYAAVLPEDLSGFNEDNQLELQVIKDDMLKNHGYYKVEDNGIETAVVSCESGVYQFVPPESKEKQWEIHTLLETPSSDAVLLDIDRDGEKELAVLSPFHGETISIYKKMNGSYQSVYVYEKPAEFSHAIFGGTIFGKPAVIIGHRQGERNLLMFTYDKKTEKYKAELLDKDCGPANVFKYEKNGASILISANREIDEIAMYTITEEE